MTLPSDVAAQFAGFWSRVLGGVALVIVVVLASMRLKEHPWDRIHRQTLILAVTSILIFCIAAVAELDLLPVDLSCRYRRLITDMPMYFGTASVVLGVSWIFASRGREFNMAPYNSRFSPSQWIFLALAVFHAVLHAAGMLGSVMGATDELSFNCYRERPVAIAVAQALFSLAQAILLVTMFYPGVMLFWNALAEEWGHESAWKLFHRIIRPNFSCKRIALLAHKVDQEGIRFQALKSSVRDLRRVSVAAMYEAVVFALIGSLGLVLAPAAVWYNFMLSLFIALATLFTITAARNIDKDAAIHPSNLPGRRETPIVPRGRNVSRQKPKWQLASKITLPSMELPMEDLKTAPAFDLEGPDSDMEEVELNMSRRSTQPTTPVSVRFEIPDPVAAAGLPVLADGMPAGSAESLVPALRDASCHFTGAQHISKDTPAETPTVTPSVTTTSLTPSPSIDPSLHVPPSFSPSVQPSDSLDTQRTSVLLQREDEREVTQRLQALMTPRTLDIESPLRQGDFDP